MEIKATTRTTENLQIPKHVRSYFACSFLSKIDEKLIENKKKLFVYSVNNLLATTPQRVCLELREVYGSVKEESSETLKNELTHRSKPSFLQANWRFSEI